MKDKLKLLGIEILYMLSVLIVSTIANPVQFLGKKIISMESGAVGCIDYGYNPVAYIAGLLIFGGYIWFSYSKVYKQFADLTLKNGIVYIFIAVIMSITLFLFMAFELLFLLTFDNNILPELLQFITMICWPGVLFIFMIAIMFPTLIKKKTAE